MWFRYVKSLLSSGIKSMIFTDQEAQIKTESTTIYKKTIEKKK